MKKENFDNELTGKIIGCAMKVHSALGPGLLESSYEECLKYELESNTISVRRQAPLPLVYNGIHLNAGYRVDLLIEKKIIVEIKSVEVLHDIHVAQLLTYLKLSGCRIGLLVNFNVIRLKDGIRRYVI
ncbi:MAG TPA: GxxExxY protein [Bacteroidia bacterium]|nr:GxxExxY protein [Bacteroidia bacterium]